MNHLLDELMNRVEGCEQENRRLRKVIKRQNFIWLATLLAAVISTATASIVTKNDVFGTIQARDITIVDQNGIVRARMSGDMPDAVMYGGHVAKRGAQAAGFMIYDKDGIERGGYVTFDHDNAMLSLDSKHHMIASLIAGPSESGTGVLNLSSQQNAMELRADDDGARMSISKSRIVQQQIPAIEPLMPETCNHWAKLEREYPNENVCRSRFSETACRRCLTDK